MTGSAGQDAGTWAGRGASSGMRVENLERLLAERGDRLLSVAVLLGGNREAGEDLLQAALERLLRNWRRIDGDPEGYLRRTLYNLAVDGWRRHGLWRKKLPLLEPAASADPLAEVDLRDQLVRLLRQLPPRQRAVIVLRYFEQLTEEEAAEVLGCSAGTVKSAASRGLTRLRELSGAGIGAGSAPAKERRS
jgi:RNA polymerase sigma-70 factor (sigma-E family)